MKYCKPLTLECIKLIITAQISFSNKASPNSSLIRRGTEWLQLILLTLVLTFGNTLLASPKIAILNFELNDITSLSNIPDEIIRTAAIKPFFETALSLTGDFQFIQISEPEYQLANPGLGYLFKFHDIAAKLGSQFGADWIIVSQHSKPSFLFSYLRVRVVNVKTGKLIARYEIELKGNHEKVTQRGVKKLAKQIKVVISDYHKIHPQ